MQIVCMAFPYPERRDGMEKTRERWTYRKPQEGAAAAAEALGIDPVVAGILLSRGLRTRAEMETFLHGDLSGLRDPFELKDMDRAAAILKRKIASGARIRVIGDYDIDGVMASYILKRGLTELGADADVRIPNRITDGYGLNPSMIGEASEEGIDTIVTCDNGIAALEAVRLAKEKGMTIIVTDHHEVLDLPEADAVVDPKRKDDTSSTPQLCGAAVAWKLILALGGDPGMDMLQYAAFATVGDIVDLTGENRIIVKEGLKRLRSTDNPGLIALAEAQGVSLANADTYQIGFVLGPCLNASGRLDTAMRAAQLLEAPDAARAKRLAGELKALNDSRKAMTETGTVQAKRMIEAHGMEDDRILVVFLPEVHESIAGIIAGRIREAYSRPALVLTRAEEGVKGSGRSIESYNMFEGLVKVKDLLLRFGGHPMAAGLTLKEETVGELRRRLNEDCGLTESDLTPKVLMDAILPVESVSEKLIRDLELLAPFGKANPKPMFGEKYVFCEHPRIFGARHSLLRMRVRSLESPEDADPDRLGFQPSAKGRPLDAICFRNVDALAERIAEDPVLSIVYEPEINEYMGHRRIQLVVTHFQ